MSTESFNEATALIVAHPGHELRIHYWLEMNRPIVHVLTDGSGRNGNSRLVSSQRTLARQGARRGDIFGVVTDRWLYNRVAAADAEPFCRLAERLATCLLRDRITRVVGDAEEHMFMSHDLFRGVRMAAVTAVERLTGESIEHFEFIVDGDPNHVPADRKDSVQTWSLSDAALQRKVDSARAYVEVSEFVDLALRQFGLDAFRKEQLFPLAASTAAGRARREVLPYEQHGQQLVAAGVYPRTIIFKHHVQPILRALENHVPTVVKRLAARTAASLCKAG